MGIGMEPDGGPIVCKPWVSRKQIAGVVEDEGIDMELANADRGLWEMVWLERVESKIG